jgi:hypothetical protein
MADKRNSIAGKVATPNLKVGAGGGGSTKEAIDVDSNLYKAVGSRYGCHCDGSVSLEADYV